jgi:hypothetical protein
MVSPVNAVRPLMTDYPQMTPDRGPELPVSFIIPEILEFGKT